MIHELKTWIPYFEDVRTGVKRFELRKNDRGFNAGDILILREWVHDDGYTGREVEVYVSYIVDSEWGLKDGYCAMSIMSVSEAIDLGLLKAVSE